MFKKSMQVLLAFVVSFGLTSSITNVAGAAPGNLVPPRQEPGGEEYIVQANDSLSKIADKYYGNPRQYPSIVEATNTKATTDSSFAPITNPNLILPGQKLWIPPQQGAGLITVDGITFETVRIDGLGLQTVIPAVWPAADEDDPLFQYAWRAGPFSFVSFTTTPGNDTLTGVARLLGVNREDITGGAIGGELSEGQFGEQTWTVYKRQEPGIKAVVAATVQEKVIYQLSLFAASSQADTIFNTILENFEIIDPTATQQIITVTAPAPETELNNPFELRGSTSQYPFRGRLIYRVLDAEGNQVGRSPFEVVGRLGNPSTFAVPGNYNVDNSGPGTVEVAEISASDGTIIAIDSVAVTLVADPAGYITIIDDPAPFATISSPTQVRGKTERKPGDGILNYRIVDAAGQQISSGFLQATGSDDQVNLFDGFAEFTTANDGPGRVEVFDVNENGSVISISSVNVWLTVTP